MTTKVRKLGNGLDILLPKEMVQKLSLKAATLIINRVRKQAPSLKELLAGITKKNVHREIDWGRPAGKEVW